MRTDKPLLVSIGEASFQLSLTIDEIVTLVRDGELVAVKVKDRVLVVYDSLTAFTRRWPDVSASVLGLLFSILTSCMSGFMARVVPLREEENRSSEKR
jgi:hypothetical protein